MYRTQVTYKDLDDNERTDTLYFRYSESEIAEMQYSEVGGFNNFLMKIMETQDQPTMMKLFRQFILGAYGEKTPDGRGFIKERPDGTKLADEFKQTEAFNQFYMRIMGDMDEMIKFTNKVFPSDFLSNSKELLAAKDKLTDNPTTQKLIDQVSAKLTDSGNN